MLQTLIEGRRLRDISDLPLAVLTMDVFDKEKRYLSYLALNVRAKVPVKIAVCLKAGYSHWQSVEPSWRPDFSFPKLGSCLCRWVLLAYVLTAMMGIF